MHRLVNFIIESGISLSFLGVLYYLFLRKETFFLQNRIFLFVSVVFSMVLPFLRFRIYEPQVVQLPELTVTPDYNFLYALTIYSQDVSQRLEQTISSTEIIVWLYAMGVLFFLLRFLYKCLQIYRLKSKGTLQTVGTVQVLTTPQAIIPFSFLNTVFIPQNLDKEEGYEQILLHEMEHVKQRHSYDILVVELLTIMQWCNPFVWLLRRAVHENHEYLADKAVLATGTQRGQYKLLLLNQCLGEQIFIGSPFNYSLIKNRIKMMNKIKSHKIANVKYLLGIFIAVGLVVSFALENKLRAGETQLPTLQDDEVTVKVVDGALSFKGSKQKLKEVLKELSKISNKSLIAEFTNDENTTSEFLLRLNDSAKEKEKGGLRDKEKTFVVVEEKPEFPGGDKALLQFLAENIKYPEEAAKQKIEGKVYLKFVVKKSGEVGEIVVHRSPHALLTAEAVRVVKLLPKFQPGIQKGKPVNLWYQIPIAFSLGSSQENSDEKKTCKV